MSDRKQSIEQILLDRGYEEYQWINPGTDLVVSRWVRMKCMFGCTSYGLKAACPPEVPGVDQCRQFFEEYSRGLLIHFKMKLDHPEERHGISRQINQILTQIEREVFLLGFPKAFVLHMDECRWCGDCSGNRLNCKNKAEARPGPEAMAVDVFTTARKLGYPIEVLTDYNKPMNRYAFLLVE